ncbi:Ig-like domain-containing protein [Nocardia sp. NPDC058519]|uniref:phage tail tube protein n=1 Tax=Nocardia sp. NPDC058519 TaxID=3346535 RepID=UPI00365B09AA
MADFATDLRKGNPDLEIAVLDWAIYLAPKNTPIPTDFTGNDSTITPLPAAYIPVGNLDKKAGTKLATAINSTPVDTYGEQTATRIIRKSRDTTVDFTMQETSMVSAGLYWGQDFSDVTADADSGEVHLVIREGAFNQEYSLIMIGVDGEEDKEVYTIIDSGRATLSKSGDITYNDDGIAMYPVTLQFLKHRTLGYATRITQAGLGWKELAPAAGYFPPVTAILLTPPTATLAAAATQQLVVTDSNGVVRTSQATYGTSDAAKATVSSSGLVTAVATGSATITATYAGFTDTTAITVS